VGFPFPRGSWRPVTRALGTTRPWDLRVRRHFQPRIGLVVLGDGGARAATCSGPTTKSRGLVAVQGCTITPDSLRLGDQDARAGRHDLCLGERGAQAPRSRPPLGSVVTRAGPARLPYPSRRGDIGLAADRVAVLVARRDGDVLALVPGSSGDRPPGRRPGSSQRLTGPGDAERGEGDGRSDARFSLEPRDCTAVGRRSPGYRSGPRGGKRSPCGWM